MIWNKKEIIEFLNKQKDWLYKIQKHRKRRSVSQNAYLHFIFSLIAEETWETTETVKEVMKSKFLKMYNTKFETVYIKPTSTLTTLELTHFIEQIRVFAWEFLWLEIPSPNDKNLFIYIDSLWKNY